MGRPLSKKYFGNRNIGTTGTGDNAIGGEGIASISWSNFGSFTGNSNVAVLTVPALPAPTIPTGVRATWTMQFEVDAVSTGAGKTNLAVGDTFGVVSIPGLIAKVTDTSGSNAVFSVTTAGASRGNALAVGSIPQDTQGITLTKIAGSGTAATFLTDISFRIKESTVTITEKGSGYVGTETFTFTKPGTTGGTVPAGTINLTTDSGNVGSATNQENAIIAYAYISGSRQVVDIVKQSGRSRYTVRGTSTVAYRAKLKGTGDASAAGEMDMYAYDSAGNTYYVTKLTQRRAYLTRKSGGSNYVYANGESAPWGFAAASGERVKINNA